MRHVRGIAPAALGLALAFAPRADAQGPGRPLIPVTPKPDAIVATGINNRGDVIGFEWIEETERPGVVAQVPFFARGKEVTYLPTLKGYTATFPAAVSDDGLVVGRASKPAPMGVRVPLRNLAFAWDAAAGIRSLGVLPDDWASFATGVTRDGRRISGFSVGNDRIRACVWDLDGDGWRATPLPHEGRLGSNVVAISDDGRYVAAVDGVLPCLWTRADSGDWTREAIGDAGSLIPRAVNNAGMVVGLRHDGEGHTHATVWTREVGIRAIPEPKGYVRSEANAVNNDGVVVGMIDGPGGSEIGPDAFVFEDGMVRKITEAGPDFTAATALNDQRQVAGVFEKEEEEPHPRPEAKPEAKADPPATGR